MKLRYLSRLALFFFPGRLAESMIFLNSGNSRILSLISFCQSVSFVSSFLSVGFSSHFFSHTTAAHATEASPVILSTVFPSLSAPFLILSVILSSVPFSAALAIADAHPIPTTPIIVFQNPNFHIEPIRSPITPMAHIAQPVLVASERIVHQVDTVSVATVHMTAPVAPATVPTVSPTTPAALPALVSGVLDTTDGAMIVEDTMDGLAVRDCTWATIAG